MSAASASWAEKSAKLPTSARTSSSVPAPKLRSCIICRSRKVRCDKQSPCSNCRRANVQCELPSTKRLPRWARRFDGSTKKAATWDASAPQDVEPDIDQALERLHNVENMVKELSSQLEQARGVTSSARGDLTTGNSPGSSTQNHDAGLQKQMSPERYTVGVDQQVGRLVVQDASRVRYVSSSFWSRIDDEVGQLVVDMPSFRLSDLLTFATARRAEDGYPRFS